MSKRTSNAQTWLPRRRGLVPRLRDVRIRTKLSLILAVPVLVVVGLASVRLVESGERALDRQDMYALVLLSQEAANLTHELQRERTAVASFLGSPGVENGAASLQEQQSKTDEAVDTYSRRRGNLTGIPTAVEPVLLRIDEHLAALDVLRRSVVQREKITLSAAAFRYRILIADLITYRETLAQHNVDPDTADRIRAVAALSKAKEYVAQQHVVTLRMLAQDNLVTQAQQRDFAATITGYQEALLVFDGIASSSAKSMRSTVVTGEDVVRAQRLEGLVSQAPLNQRLQLPDTDKIDWSKAMTGRADRMREVERTLDTAIVTTVTEARDTQVQQLIVESGAVVVTLLLAILITLVVARAMARSLQRLREGALAVAYEGLPRAVARLRDPETLGEHTPEEVAAQAPDPVQVRGRDETGQVALAFNVVHREAIRVAAEQASLRASVSTMFVNLARRSQILVDRLIGHLDRLEQGEEDPDRLAQLFQLDHLATRMRRNNENLLVLADTDSSRVRRDPAPLGDVLRAAQSEVEQYTRIEFGIIDREVQVAAHAVNDVVHLLAELFDNAASFSPPSSAVVVDARRVGDRAIIQIEDRGIGISPEQLAEFNQRLAKPPTIDVSVSRMMGLVVVARIAARQRIRVELRNARERGTLVDVVLPSGVLILGDRAGRRQAGLPRPPEPLALGSGPAAQNGRPRPFDAAPGMPSTVTSSNGRGDHAVPRRGTSADSLDAELRSLTSQGTGMAADAPPARGFADFTGELATSQETARPAPPPRPAPEPATGTGLPRRATPAAEPAAPEPQPRGLWDAATPPADTSHAGTSMSPPAAPRVPAAVPSRPGERDAPVPPNPEDTMELPIFRELESAWFRTGTSRARTPAPATAAAASGPPAGTPPPRPAMETMPSRKPESGPPPAAPTSQPATVASSAGRGGSRPPAPSGPSGPSGPPPVAGSPSGGPAAAPPPPEDWRSAADEGWQAATAASQPVSAGSTGAGLPKRVPMAQLVPGGVQPAPAQPTPKTQHRSPEAVRGLLSAYQSGVQRGRGRGTSLTPRKPTTNPSKEQER